MEVVRNRKNKQNYKECSNSMEETEENATKHLKLNGGRAENIPDLPAQKCNDQKEELVTSNNASKFRKLFKIHIEIDVVSIILFLGAIATRMYKLEQPRNIV